MTFSLYFMFHDALYNMIRSEDVDVTPGFDTVENLVLIIVQRNAAKNEHVDLRNGQMIANEVRWIRTIKYASETGRKYYKSLVSMLLLCFR